MYNRFNETCAGSINIFCDFLCNIWLINETGLAEKTIYVLYEIWALMRMCDDTETRDLLLLLYGYYQSRFGLIPRSRGGRWGLIKATVCSNILQMFVRY